MGFRLSAQGSHGGQRVFDLRPELIGIEDAQAHVGGNRDSRFVRSISQLGELAVGQAKGDDRIALLTLI
jgi:hypothetical protein